MRLLLAALLALSLAAADPPVRRESTEWTDVWMPNTNAKDLPRVMLIGDSITRAYFTAVEERLKGKAYLARIATSKAIGDPALLDEIRVFLAQSTYAVVHCNIGMHGWAYTEDEYRQHLPALYATIRKAAPNAKIIWAQTTPVRKDREGGAQNSRIQKRNAIAREFFTANGIPINDLHSAVAGHEELHSDDIHFNKEGSALLATEVASVVAKLLLPPPVPKP